MIKLITYLLTRQNPSAPQRQHLKGHQLATTATPRWREPQGNILVLEDAWQTN
jgi:hypothetical protein